MAPDQRLAMNDNVEIMLPVTRRDVVYIRPGNVGYTGTRHAIVLPECGASSM